MKGTNTARNSSINSSSHRKGQIQTNLRLGRLDFQLRHRRKGDDTPWKEIPILQIPKDAPGPQMDLIENPAHQPSHQPEFINPKTINSRQEYQTPDNEDPLTDTRGSITEQLRYKHKMSPSPSQPTLHTEKKKTSSIHHNFLT